MLKCETNTPEMELRIRAAFQEFMTDRKFPDTEFETVFEHDQWWVIADVEDEGSLQWSVSDAHGLHTFDGFDFELVS